MNWPMQAILWMMRLFLTYVLMSLPQEEYQTMILVLKVKLRKGALTIEEAKNLLDDKFEAMKELSGWNEEGEDHLVVRKLQFKRT